MKSNALKKEQQLFSNPKESPLFLVDVKELTRVTERVMGMSWDERNAPAHMKHKIFFQKDGKIASKSLGAFIDSGIAGQVKGLNACLNCQDYAERLDALQTLEAIIMVVSSPKERGDHDLTKNAASVAAKRTFIAAHKENFQPSEIAAAAYLRQKDVKLNYREHHSL